MFKLYAFEGARQRKLMTDPATREAYDDDPRVSSSLESFPDYYKAQLMEDAKKPARQINEDELTPKRKRQLSSLYSTYTQEKTVDPYEGYMGEKEQAEKFFEDHEKYAENNLEQVERQELFYVLEQFFASQQQAPATGDKPGDKALKEA